MGVTTTHHAHVNGARITGHARATHLTTTTLAHLNAYVIVGSFEVVPLRDFGFSGGDIKASSTHISCHEYHYLKVCASRGNNHRGCMHIRRG